MIIGDFNINSVDAKQLTFDIQSMDITNNSSWGENISPFFVKNLKGFKKITLTLLFKGISRKEILNNISKVINKMDVEKFTLKADGYSHLFICSLEKTEIIKTISKIRYTLQIELKAYEISEIKQIEEKNITNKVIDYAGTIETPLTMIITPLTAGNLIIDGVSDSVIKINNVIANTDITINSISETVSQGITNKYNDTDMWEFPRLNLGTNTITFSMAVNVIFKYEERFI